MQLSGPGIVTRMASACCGQYNIFRRAHSPKHQQPHFNRSKCMMGLCFSIKLKFCIWLMVFCTEGEKWLFYLLFVSKSQQQALGINIHSGFSNTGQKTSIASVHIPSLYPPSTWWMALASWVVRLCTFLCVDLALRITSSTELLQNSCIWLQLHS